MSGFFRITKEGFSNFIRNGWLSVASITIMVLTLLTMSMFIIINIVLNSGIKTIQDKIDISIYLSDGAKTAQVVDFQNDLARLENVKDHGIIYVSKDTALSRYKEQNKDNPKILESLSISDNPLPASLEIKVKDPNKLNEITSVIEQDKYKPLILDNGKGVSYKGNEEIISRLTKATTFTKQAGLVATIAFMATSLVIIFNTVRMAIFTRREEIDIMKLVGATPNFIKAPFLFEGALYGVISTAISILVMSAIFYFSAPKLITYFGGVGNNVSDFLRQNIFVIVLAQVAVGVAIGVISSYLAIRKHLKTA